MYVSSVEPPAPSDLSALPLAVVQQITSTQTDAEGGLSTKECVIHYFRLEQTTTELDARDIATAADDLGHMVEPMMGGRRDLGAGVLVDRARVRVRRAVVGVPTVTDPDNSASGLAWAFSRRLAATARTPGWAIHQTKGGSLETSHVTITPGSAKLLSQTAGEGDTTELQLEARISVAQHETVGVNVPVVVRSIAPELDGIVVSGLGRLADVQVDVRSRGTARTPVYAVTLKATATCRLA